MATYSVVGPIPLVEGFAVSTNGGVIDTRTEVANSLHPLLNLVAVVAVTIRIWDTAVGGTAKGFASINHNWRLNVGVPAWVENAAPQTTGGSFQVAAMGAITNMRAGVAFNLGPVNWNANVFPFPVFQIDDYAMRIVTDATTNPGTFWASAYVVRIVG